MAEFENMTRPIAEIEKLTGIACQDKVGGVSYWQEGALTHENLAKCVECGLANPGDQQNDSPSIGEFLSNFTPPNLVGYIGYVVWPPRADSRVSVDGVIMDFDTRDEAKIFADRYANADESNIWKIESGSAVKYLLRLWWD